MNMAATPILQVRNVKGYSNTRLEPVMDRLRNKEWYGRLSGDVPRLNFDFPNGGKIRQLGYRDVDHIAAGRELMVGILGENEVEAVEIMREYVKDYSTYLLVFEGKGKVLGAALGFYNDENKSAQQIILTVDENYRQQGIGSALSACRLAVASIRAGGIGELSYITSELVPADTGIIAQVYKDKSEGARGNAFAAKFVYPLPPLSDDWMNDGEMIVLPHVLMMVPVSKERSAEKVPIAEFRQVVVGNQRALYGDEKTAIVEREIKEQIGRKRTVPLVSLNVLPEREDLGREVKVWGDASPWTPDAVRRAVGYPLPGKITKK